MKIKMVVTGMLGENCWIVSDDDGNAAVVDPGDNAGRILDEILRDELKVAWILITHSHFDHVGALAKLHEATGAPVAVHELEADELPVQADRLLGDGDTLPCGQMTFEVMHTPGHTPGSVVYLCGDAMFSGDTLFWESIGRTDLPGGDFSDMRRTLKKIRELDREDLRIFPGHMQQTTLAYERVHNPFFGL